MYLKYSYMHIYISTQLSSYVIFIHSWSCHLLAPTSTTDWFTKGHVMYYHVCDNACKRSLTICHKSRALLAGFCLSLYSLHVPNRDFNVIQFRHHTLLYTQVLVSFNPSLKLFQDVACFYHVCCAVYCICT